MSKPEQQQDPELEICSENTGPTLHSFNLLLGAGCAKG